MAVSFQSDEEVLRKLRDKLRKMTDEALVRFGKEVRRLAENPFSGSWKKLGGSGSLVETLGNTGRYKNFRSPMALRAAVWHP
jgi:hypothetical protein